MNTNFSKPVAVSFAVLFLISNAFAATAQFTIISADNALNATNPAFTTLSDIVMRESKVNDFAATKGNSTNLILTAPAGWAFRPASGKVLFAGSQDLSAVSLTVSSTTISITFKVNGVAGRDVLTIAGIEVQALDGSNIDCKAIIYRSALNPGSAVINGVISGTHVNGSPATAFATIMQSSGVAARLAFASRPFASRAGGRLEQQPVIITQDQFGNPTTKGLDADQTVKIKLSSGTGRLLGTTVSNIGTLGGNGQVAYKDLQLSTPGVKKLIVTSGSLSFAISSEIIINEEESNTKVSSEDAEDFYSDWMCFAVQSGQISVS